MILLDHSPLSITPLRHKHFTHFYPLSDILCENCPIKRHFYRPLFAPSNISNFPFTTHTHIRGVRIFAIIIGSKFKDVQVIMQNFILNSIFMTTFSPLHYYFYCYVYLAPCVHNHIERTHNPFRTRLWLLIYCNDYRTGCVFSI